MGYDKLTQDLADFDAALATTGFTIPGNSPLADQLATTRDFLQDKASLPEDDWLRKWQPRFKDFYDAQIVVARLTHAISVLRDKPQGILRKYLKTISSGPLTQGSDPNQAKDFFYELWLASVLAEGGFDVELREPDIVVTGNGLTKELGIACKYPSTEKQVHAHLSKGYSQISKHTGDGIVAIGLDLIVLRTAFPDGVNYLDFRQNDKHPVDVLQKLVDEATVHLVDARPKLYPSEDPVDGAMLTLTFGGIFGEPPAMTFVSAVALQCSHSNPNLANVGLIRDGIYSLNPDE
ncbi:MAG: hypothetical protein RIC55_27620 [Pirellulaceae bacterium]